MKDTFFPFKDAKKEHFPDFDLVFTSRKKAHKNKKNHHDNAQSQKQTNVTSPHQNYSISCNSVSNAENIEVALDIGTRSEITMHQRHVMKHGFDSNEFIIPFKKRKAKLSICALDEQWEQAMENDGCDFDIELQLLEKETETSTITPNNNDYIHNDKEDDYFNSSQVKLLHTPPKHQKKFPRIEITHRVQRGLESEISYYSETSSCDESSACGVEVILQPSSAPKELNMPSFSSSSISSSPSSFCSSIHESQSSIYANSSVSSSSSLVQMTHILSTSLLKPHHKIDITQNDDDDAEAAIEVSLFTPKDLSFTTSAVVDNNRIEGSFFNFSPRHFKKKLEINLSPIKKNHEAVEEEEKYYKRYKRKPMKDIIQNSYKAQNNSIDEKSITSSMIPYYCQHSLLSKSTSDKENNYQQDRMQSIAKRIDLMKKEAASKTSKDVNNSCSSYSEAF